jgi:hypothetical protein
MSDEDSGGNTNENPEETANDNQVETTNENPEVNANVSGNANVSLQKLEIVDTLREGFELTIKNIGPVFVNLLLWVLTIWIPYINVGTTIGMFSGIIIKLSREETISFTEIFEPKYREYMGEYFITLGLMIIGTYMGIAFLIIPGIIISIAWSFALILVVDKEKTPIEALTLSNKITFGYKGRIFLISLILMIIMIVLIIVLSRLGSDFALLLIFIAYIFFILLYIGIQASMYKQLTRDAK